MVLVKHGYLEQKRKPRYRQLTVDKDTNLYMGEKVTSLINGAGNFLSSWTVTEVDLPASTSTVLG